VLLPPRHVLLTPPPPSPGSGRVGRQGYQGDGLDRDPPGDHTRPKGGAGAAEARPLRYNAVPPSLTST